MTFLLLALLALMALLFPTFTIREKDYIQVEPSRDNVFRSLIKTFQNGDFRLFVGSDILYFIALTIFQTGLPFFVTVLMKLPETMTTLLYVGMTLLSFAAYAPVNYLAHRVHKKKLVLIGFCGLSLVYLVTALSGLFGRTWGFCRRPSWRTLQKRTHGSRERRERGCFLPPEPLPSKWARAFPCFFLRRWHPFIRRRDGGTGSQPCLPLSSVSLARGCFPFTGKRKYLKSSHHARVRIRRKKDDCSAALCDALSDGNPVKEADRSIHSFRRDGAICPFREKAPRHHSFTSSV